MIKIAYLAHPVAGDVPGNLASTRRWFNWIVRNFPDVAVNVPWYIYVSALDDRKPEDRLRGMRDDVEILKRCDEVWLCGPRISPGMRDEIEVAEKHGITVRDMITYAPWVERGEFPPEGIVPGSWFQE